MSRSTQTGQLIYFVVQDRDRNPEFCLRNKQNPRCVYFVARKPFLTHEFYPRNTQNARCVCFVMSIDLIFCLHMQSAPSPEYATSGDYSSGAAVSSSVGLSSRPAAACCPRNTPSSRFPCPESLFQHCPTVKCPISCRMLPFSLFRITISAPSLSRLPFSLSDDSGYLVQNHYFCTVPQYNARFLVGRSRFPCPRTTISAPSYSKMPDFLSDAPGYLVQNHYFCTVPQYNARFLVGRSRFPCPEPLFQHRPTVKCPIFCRTLSCSLFRTAISAPSLSRLPFSLSDAPIFAVLNEVRGMSSPYTSWQVSLALQ